MRIDEERQIFHFSLLLLDKLSLSDLTFLNLCCVFFFLIFNYLLLYYVLILQKHKRNRTFFVFFTWKHTVSSVELIYIFPNKQRIVEHYLEKCRPFLHGNTLCCVKSWTYLPFSKRRTNCRTVLGKIAGLLYFKRKEMSNFLTWKTERNGIITICRRHSQWVGKDGRKVRFVKKKKKNCRFTFFGLF